MTDQSGGTPGGLLGDVVKFVENALDFSHTDFESYSHEALLSMIEHADPDAIAGFGDRLTGAVTKIHQIGSDLNDHIAYVDWEGQSGAAFKDWGKNVAKSTLALGDYADSTGKALSAAADTLRTVKRDMPPVPAAAKSTVEAYHAQPALRHDPDGQQEYSHANTQLETARIQAADQMHKLAQSYSFSTAIINSSQPPTYPPMPGAFVPPTDVREIDPVHYSSTGGGSTPYSSSGSGGSTSHASSTDRAPLQHVSSSTSSTPHSSSTSPVATPVKPITTPQQTQLQSTGPLSPVATAPQPIAQAPTTGGGPTTGLPVFNPSAPPPANPVQSVGGPGPSLPNPLRNGNPPVESSANPVNTGVGRGIGGGLTPRNPSAMPSEEIGAAPPMRRSPANGIYGGRPAVQGEAFGGGGRSQGQIYGGRPAVEGETFAGGRAQGQVPRGSVVGGRGAAARMPAGGGVPEGGPSSGGGRVGMGRSGAGRLASEPGGVVGQTPANEFGPGGVSSSRGNNERRRGQRRPDHLIEEDDWIPTRDDVAPPVID